MFTQLLNRISALAARGEPGPAVPLPVAGESVLVAPVSVTRVPAIPKPVAAPAICWTPARLQVVESLWGEGYVFPNGHEEALRLARSLALSNATSLLLVGAGSGGPAFAIAAELGAWVSGFEADPTLAAVATERGVRGGFGRRAEIKTWEPQEPNFSRRTYHHAMALEALRGGQVGATLVSVFRALRPGGQLVMIDLVADSRLDPDDEAVRAWCRMENRSPAVPSERAITEALGGLGFDVRVAEDISVRHMQQALRGWHQAIRHMQASKPHPTVARLIVAEAELWLRRVSLLRARRIRLVRWHAIRAAG